MNRHSRIASTLLTTAALTLTVAPVEATAQRQGFVIGFGIGPSMTSMAVGEIVSYARVQGGVSSESGLTERIRPARRDIRYGLATDFKIGFAPRPDLAVYWSADTQFYDHFGIRVVGVGGLGVTRFLSPGGRFAYIDGSVGMGTAFELAYPTAEGFDSGRGIGATLGTGFAVGETWFFDVDMVFTKPTEKLTTLGMKLSMNWLSR